MRPIQIRTGVLARTHGSALFTRGETQALVTTTLGTKEDEQRLETINLAETSKRLMLHYNFPPFSVGEVGFMRGPGRREVGHGALAERSILAVMPSETDFPYTMRVVSDILESNGSSSMATVCGAILSMMDAGVKIKAPVAGIAMGLVKEGDKYAILTDIAGAEDHYGDMDFKVAGTRVGITGLQMDIKVPNISVNKMCIRDRDYRPLGLFDQARGDILFGSVERPCRWRRGAVRASRVASDGRDRDRARDESRRPSRRRIRLPCLTWQAGGQ